ncbi:MAG: hypothetical protein ACXVCV_06250 [Polyangia bacterium]
MLMVMAGCTGDLVELTAGGGKQDMSFAGVDMAQAAGGEMGPSGAVFTDIQTDLDAKGCTITACHGTSGNGSVMFVKPMATVQADIDANYMHVMAEINTTQADQSPLLRNPLAGSGSGHAGTTPFASTADPTYQKWLAWIKAGAPK